MSNSSVVQDHVYSSNVILAYVLRDLWVDFFKFYIGHLFIATLGFFLLVVIPLVGLTASFSLQSLPFLLLYTLYLQNINHIRYTPVMCTAAVYYQLSFFEAICEYHSKKLFAGVILISFIELKYVYLHTFILLCRW